MSEPRFNLIDESWIKCISMQGEECKTSIKELLETAHELKSLTGETELQNTAVLRFLIALNVTLLYRYDENGNEAMISDRREALRRFEAVWEAGEFPEKAFTKYLSKWHDRFYLSGGERPFYQVPENRRREITGDKKSPNGKTWSVEPYKDSDKLGWVSAAAMNGEVLESANSPSPFTNRMGKDKNSMELDEAARWLLYYMSFVDCSAKIPGKWNAGKTAASGGANIYPSGENLFQTIMLCSALLNQNKGVYTDVCPAWENESYTEINASPYGDDGFPTNLPELYTQQSRKIVLHMEDGRVNGAFVAAGDRYGTVNLLVEPMFAFHEDKKDKSGQTLLPNHIYGGSAWKEFRNIFAVSKSNPARWINVLFDREILSDDINIPYFITDIEYGAMSCGVKRVLTSGVTINRRFFVDSEETQCAAREIERINQIARALETLGKQIDMSQGKDERSGALLASALKDKYENLIGNNFCLYLSAKIDRCTLQNEEFRLAYQTANDVLDALNITAIGGHGENTVGKAENMFFAMMKKLEISTYGMKRDMMKRTDE